MKKFIFYIAHILSLIVFWRIIGIEPTIVICLGYIAAQVSYNELKESENEK